MGPAQALEEREKFRKNESVFHVLLITCYVFVWKVCFWASPCKTMQNHLDISSKTQFWIRSVRNWTKSRDMEGKPSGKHIFFNAFYEKMLFLASRQHVLMVLTCLWVSWLKNYAERSRNYFKNLILNPKHAKFDQNPSFGHVRAVGGIMRYSGSVSFKHLLR